MKSITLPPYYQSIIGAMLQNPVSGNEAQQFALLLMKLFSFKDFFLLKYIIVFLSGILDNNESSLKIEAINTSLHVG